MERIFSDHTASISELKKNPMGIVENAEGHAVAILNRNHTVFYCIPAKTYEKLMDVLDDAELLSMAKARLGQEAIPVSIDDL